MQFVGDLFVASILPVPSKISLKSIEQNTSIMDQSCCACGVSSTRNLQPVSTFMFQSLVQSYQSLCIASPSHSELQHLQHHIEAVLQSYLESCRMALHQRSVAVSQLEKWINDGQQRYKTESIRWQHIGDLTLMDMAYSLYDADQRRLACCHEIQKLHQSLIEQQINYLVQTKPTRFLLSSSPAQLLCFPSGKLVDFDACFTSVTNTNTISVQGADVFWPKLIGGETHELTCFWTEWSNIAFHNDVSKTSESQCDVASNDFQKTPAAPNVFYSPLSHIVVQACVIIARIHHFQRSADRQAEAVSVLAIQYDSYQSRLMVNQTPLHATRQLILTDLLHRAAISHDTMALTFRSLESPVSEPECLGQTVDSKSTISRIRNTRGVRPNLGSAVVISVTPLLLSNLSTVLKTHATSAVSVSSLDVGASMCSNPPIVESSICRVIAVSEQSVSPWSCSPHIQTQTVFSSLHIPSNQDDPHVMGSGECWVKLRLRFLDDCSLCVTLNVIPRHHPPPCQDDVANEAVFSEYYYDCSSDNGDGCIEGCSTISTCIEGCDSLTDTPDDILFQTLDSAKDFHESVPPDLPPSTLTEPPVADWSETVISDSDAEQTDDAQLDDFYFHPLNPIDQQCFEDFICDQRFAEGMSLLGWVQQLSFSTWAAIEPIDYDADQKGHIRSPENVLKFVTDFASFMESKFSVCAAHWASLRLYIDRLVFKRLDHYQVLTDLTSSLAQADDRSFELQMRWLVFLSPTQLGMHTALCSLFEHQKWVSFSSSSTTISSIPSNVIGLVATNDRAIYDSPLVCRCIIDVNQPEKTHIPANDTAATFLNASPVQMQFPCQECGGDRSVLESSNLNIVSLNCEKTSFPATLFSRAPVLPSFVHSPLLFKLVKKSLSCDSSCDTMPQTFRSKCISGSVANSKVFKSILSPAWQIVDEHVTINIGFPFWHAIEILHELAELRVPVDILNCMVRVLQSINHETHVYWDSFKSTPDIPIVLPHLTPTTSFTHLSVDSLVLDADTLFPIVLWVVIHSELYHSGPHFLLSIVDRFREKITFDHDDQFEYYNSRSAQYANFGLASYARTLIEAAIQLITTINPSQLIGVHT